jgi:hypothetical protein
LYARARRWLVERHRYKHSHQYLSESEYKMNALIDLETDNPESGILVKREAMYIQFDSSHLSWFLLFPFRDTVNW